MSIADSSFILISKPCDIGVKIRVAIEHDNSDQMGVKYEPYTWSNHGQIMVKSWSNHGQIMVKSWSNHGHTVTKS